MVDKLKLTTYVELLAYFERVGELPVHLTLEDRVVKQVEDHSMGVGKRITEFPNSLLPHLPGKS